MLLILKVSNHYNDCLIFDIFKRKVDTWIERMENAILTKSSDESFDFSIFIERLEYRSLENAMNLRKAGDYKIIDRDALPGSMKMSMDNKSAYSLHGMTFHMDNNQTPIIPLEKMEHLRSQMNSDEICIKGNLYRKL